MSKLIRKARHGFTLVEIMIVVLIIGILLAVAVPNFINARESSRTKSCVANLRKIKDAKAQYAMDNKLGDADAIPDGALWAAGAQLESKPTCPSDGDDYVVGTIGENPTCPNGGTHVLP